jgi:peptidoglycan hydrolase CwlO-like protein
MSFARDAYAAFKKILLVEERISQLSEGVKRLQEDVNQHGERLARLEGKFDLLEQALGSRRRKLTD